MHAPEYLICLNCETACYVFEWEDDKISEAFCQVCGNEDIEQFATEEDFEAMIGEEKKK